MKRTIRFENRSSTLEWTRQGDMIRFRFDDGSQRDASLVEVEDGVYSVLLGPSHYEVRIDGPSVEIRGRSIPIEVIDPRATVFEARADAGEGRASITATMPGKVVRVLVSTGDQVRAGQGLVVVEAMKMQNELKSPKAGRVVTVEVRETEPVTAGQILAIVE